MNDPINYILDDPFNIDKVNMMLLLSSITEAWSRKRKDEIVAKEKAKGHELVEHAIMGEYDLTLWRVPTHDGVYLLVALNGGQADPTDISAQQYTAQTYGQIPWQTISRQIAKWVDAYGSVVVGSAVEAKTKRYLKWLTRLGYRLVPFMASDYRYGAVISKERGKKLAEQIVEHFFNR